MIIAKLTLDVGIYQLWYVIVLCCCFSVDCGVKLHLHTAPNCVKELSPEEWQCVLPQLLS